MSVTLKPYPEYKDSSVPWLGRIPAHWRILRGKFLFSYRKELNSDRQNANVLSLTLRGVVDNDPWNPEGLVPKDYATYQIFRQGDLVFKLIDLENLRTSRVGLVHKDGIMSPAYIRLVPRSAATARFFWYQFFDLYLRGVFNRLGAGVRATLGPQDLLNISLLVPCDGEKQQITAFVCQQDTQIARFIRARRRLIALLNEQKQAIIERAVTTGLVPGAHLKPSGIDWLGLVPRHWQVVRAKYAFREVDKRSSTGNEPHLSMSQKLGLVRENLIEERRLMSESYVGGKLCEKGDLVLNRLKAHLGVFATAHEPGLVSADYTVLRAFRNAYTPYYELLFRTPACRAELHRRAKGIVEGFWRLYTDDFYNIPLPLPSAEEQRAIVAQLDAQLGDLRSASSALGQDIERTREYRTRLIADVVTGKLDVRGAALPALEAVEEQVSFDDAPSGDETEEGQAAEPAKEPVSADE